MSLFSREFKDFIDNIPATSNTVEEIAGQITKSITPVADLIGIGKLEITMVHSPATAFAPPINNGTIMLYYFSGGYEEAPVNYDYTTAINGQVRLTAYPRKNLVWTDEDLLYLETLAKILYTLCAKARITSLLNIAATTDGLTSVPNSIGTYQFIGSVCGKGIESEYTAIFYNIKGFRVINQRFNAKNGDIALKKYAQKIKDSLDDDEIIGRMGGDNFVSLVKNEHLNQFLELISNVKVILNINNKIIPVEISARAGVYPIVSGDTVSIIMNNISIAANVAKRSQHHDFIWFRPTMMERTIHDKELAGAFANALETNEFEVFYQPKIDFSTKKLCGCEALSRWRRNGELLQPGQFIPILEREGTICALDFYVLNKVCEDIKDWISKGLTPVRVSTNFSRLHMHNLKLAEDIFNVIQRKGIDPSYIEIELTESIGYDDFDALEKFVNKLHGYGISTSLDDFGTGYSSLNLLSELHVDVIKLDKSFVTPPKQAEDETEASYKQRLKSNHIVIKTIINMALELGLDVICEGVETKEQAAMLEDLGCHMAQGFLYDKPIPHDEFENRLTNGDYNDYNV
jgi:diguanylate cyclase (GGDEF)-like protein